MKLPAKRDPREVKHQNQRRSLEKNDLFSQKAHTWSLSSFSLQPVILHEFSQVSPLSHW